MDWQPSHHHSDDGRTSGELPSLNCHITSLCDHIQSEGSNHGLLSNVIVMAILFVASVSITCMMETFLFSTFPNRLEFQS
ncbi:hypothetical protein Hdeb2414_s0008g00265341 [Helianthus debilis subsp. tardiflorus]